MSMHCRRCSGTLAFAVLFACTSCPAAEKFTGVVTRVIDGETLIVRYLDQHISVQLAGIDAPDAGERYGKPSAQSLAKLCYQRTAQVTSDRSDEWGRVLARVSCNGIDVNKEQLRRGFGRLETRQGAPAEWRAMEAQARTARRGIWSGGAR